MLRSLPRPDGEEGVKTDLAEHSLGAELVNPLAENSWEETIMMHRDATIFHSTGWARVLVDTYGHRPCYAQISLNGNLQAACSHHGSQKCAHKSARGLSAIVAITVRRFSFTVSLGSF